MSKVIAWISTGLVLGVLVMVVIRPSNVAPEHAAGGLTSTDVGSAAIAVPSFIDNEDLADRLGQLESRIDELEEELTANGRQRLASGGVTTVQDASVAVERAAAVSTPSERSVEIAERLVAGGFAPDRAQWIVNRSEELLMAQIEARYAAEREGKPLAMEALERLGPQYVLREDLGDWEYERYLQVLGRPTSVGVANALENSPAARAGLMSGDQIVSYGGTRVFNVFEVTQLTREGVVGESMLVDILRNGQPMQIVVPRGPLGAALSGNGLPGAVVLPSAQNQ